MGERFLTSNSLTSLGVIILVSISALIHRSDANIYEVAIFTDVTSTGFNHLTVHNGTGDVYVGGVNQVYRLNAGLELSASVTTGPEYDDDDEAYDTFNKILTINYNDSELVTCGGYQGVCQKRHVHDLSVTYETGDPVYVVSNKTDESTVGFVAPHYYLYQPLMYVGSTSTSVNPGSPLVSGRQLQGNNIFEVFEDGVGTTRADVLPSLINTFPVSYVAGFSYSGYSYFVTTQKSSTSGSEYISKLVRVCQQAEQQFFNSYTEVTLKCRDDSYNLAQAAYITRPGQDLTQSLALDDNEEVLFVAFAVGENDPPTPTTVSAICMYRMGLIEKAFQDAAEGCMTLDGIPEYSASWMRGASCASAFPFYRGIHECHALNYYTYANGVNDQYGHAVEDYPDTLVTSIAVTTVEQHTVGFLGTDEGHVLKVHLVNSSYANTYESINFEESDTQVLPDMTFDSDEIHFYRLSARSVRKLKVEDCNQYTTCTSCLGSRDPYCGWCLLDRRCSIQASCEDSHPSSRWLHYFNDDNECVGMAIESIDP